MRGDYPLVKEIYTKLYNDGKAGKFGYSLKLKRETDYYLGFYYRATGQYDSALVYLNESIELSKKTDKNDPSGFWVNALLFKGQMYDKLNKRDEAIKCYNEVLGLKEYNNSHKSAKYFISEPYR